MPSLRHALFLTLFLVACFGTPSGPTEEPGLSLAGTWRGSSEGFDLGLSLGKPPYYLNSIGTGLLTNTRTQEARVLVVWYPNVLVVSGDGVLWAWWRWSLTSDSTMTTYVVAPDRRGYAATYQFLGADSVGFVLKR